MIPKSETNRMVLKTSLVKHIFRIKPDRKAISNVALLDRAVVCLESKSRIQGYTSGKEGCETWPGSLEVRQLYTEGGPWVACLRN